MIDISYVSSLSFISIWSLRGFICVTNINCEQNRECFWNQHYQGKQPHLPVCSRKSVGERHLDESYQQGNNPRETNFRHNYLKSVEMASHHSFLPLFWKICWRSLVFTSLHVSDFKSFSWYNLCAICFLKQFSFPSDE